MATVVLSTYPLHDLWTQVEIPNSSSWQNNSNSSIFVRPMGRMGSGAEEGSVWVQSCLMLNQSVSGWVTSYQWDWDSRPSNWATCGAYLVNWWQVCFYKSFDVIHFLQQNNYTQLSPDEGLAGERNGRGGSNAEMGELVWLVTWHIYKTSEQVLASTDEQQLECTGQCSGIAILSSLILTRLCSFAVTWYWCCWIMAKRRFLFSLENSLLSNVMY